MYIVHRTIRQLKISIVASFEICRVAFELIAVCMYVCVWERERERVYVVATFLWAQCLSAPANYKSSDYNQVRFNLVMHAVTLCDVFLMSRFLTSRYVIHLVRFTVVLNTRRRFPGTNHYFISNITLLIRIIHVYLEKGFILLNSKLEIITRNIYFNNNNSLLNNWRATMVPLNLQ